MHSNRVDGFLLSQMLYAHNTCDISLPFAEFLNEQRISEALNGKANWLNSIMYFTCVQYTASLLIS